MNYRQGPILDATIKLSILAYMRLEPKTPTPEILSENQTSNNLKKKKKYHTLVSKYDQ